jgi:hypothetical protein
MLILSRRIGEIIRIGPHNAVTVLGVNGAALCGGFAGGARLSGHDTYGSAR